MYNIVGIDASTKSTGVAYYKNGKLCEYALIKSSDRDVYNRIIEIRNQIRKFLKGKKTDYIFIENVPLSHTVNRLVAEHLLVLQGVIFSVADECNAKFIPLQPTNWRKLACVVADGKKREFQKKAAIELVVKKYGFDFRWVDSKTDEKTGDSDICEAILIGAAGIIYLNKIIEEENVK